MEIIGYTIIITILASIHVMAYIALGKYGLLTLLAYPITALMVYAAYLINKS